jgi:hypothetical protein
MNRTMNSVAYTFDITQHCRHAELDRILAWLTAELAKYTDTNNTQHPPPRTTRAALDDAPEAAISMAAVLTSWFTQGSALSTNDSLAELLTGVASQPTAKYAAKYTRQRAADAQVETEHHALVFGFGARVAATGPGFNLEKFDPVCFPESVAATEEECFARPLSL